jgi:hypothetical protein
VLPADDAELVPDLEARPVELERAEERLRAESARLVVPGEERSGVGLRRDVVVEARRPAEVRVPLDRREQARGVEVVGDRGEAGGDPADGGGKAAELLDLPPERAAEEDRVRPLRRDELGARRLEALAGEAREPARRGDRGDRRPRRQDAGERDEVPARGRRQRDDAGQALDVVRGGAVVPDDAAGRGPGDRAGRVAPVGAEDGVAALAQLLVELGRAGRLAPVVEEDELRARVARERAQALLEARALDGVAARPRDGRAEPLTPSRRRASARSGS